MRSERFPIPPLLILVREKTSSSFDMVIESNLLCPLQDIVYGEDCRSQNTNTNRRGQTHEVDSKRNTRDSQNKGGTLGRMVDPKKGHSVKEL